MRIKLLTLFVLTISFIANAQYIDQNITQPIDVNSKAFELGINEEQLQSILNSASGESKEGKGDPLPEAMQQRLLTGAAANDNFGYTVSSAGDVNGDGYDDLIVGAPLNDAGGMDAGRAYIYYGGNIFDNTADVVLTGSYANDQFGRSVSTAGDVNGDGYSDVIVGANGYNSSTGRVYIYYGGTFMNNVADVIITGATINDAFGNAVSTAGDVNGDGYSDVIVGATGNDTGGTDRGQAYIYFGGASMNNVVDVTLAGEAAGDNFGNAVSGAGDVNGDGYSDVIVGAWLNDGSGTDAGRAYIFYGGLSMNNTADVVLTGAAANDWFAISVSTAGDVNGDGYADVIVGSPLNDAGGSDAGGAYIYYGGSQMNNAADVTLTGAAAGNWFGFSVSDAGDVNGDAFSDVVVGAFLNSAGGTNAGRAYLYWGGESMDIIADGIVTGAAAFDFFGFSVSNAGDFNGDGYNDFMVGAYANDAGGTDAGKAYLYINTLTGSDMPDEIFYGSVDTDFFGYKVSTAGDVNGDGYPDVIVGAPKNDAGGIDAGRAYIYFGGSVTDNIADIILSGASAGDEFGKSVSTAGDVNGDGYDDVIVGASLNDAGGLDAGRAYVYFGGVTMDNIADLILTGVAAGDEFGRSVSAAGDVNGDGYDDIIIGAPFNDVQGTDAGQAYIYFGGQLMNNIVDITLSYSFAIDQFGYSVSNAGDVNNDGYDDVIVGAPTNDLGGIDAGMAVIYLGSFSMDNQPDIILIGNNADDRFGFSVSCAGDVTGDGYADVIVGAYNNDEGGYNAGSAYIFYGGFSMNNLYDVVFFGQSVANFFGWSVSTAGDINGDGYDDVVIGATGNYEGGTSAGKVYVYFGGTNMDNEVDVTMTGTQFSGLGFSVAKAGDINKDGYEDILVGTPDGGKAYLYLSSPPQIKPIMISVKDIPLDQGSFVRVRWLRSGYDIISLNRISEYIIQRSDPPGTSGFVWDYVATIPALREPQYSYVSPTPSDSFSNSSGTFYFRVIARGTNPSEKWYSNIVSGHSVDNLAPFAPVNFYANLNGSNIKLGWKANTEPDLRNYHIYRSETPISDNPVNERTREIDSPDALTLIGTTTDTTFIDTSPLVGNSYYYIQAYDIHNNGSPYSSDSIMAFLSASIKVFLEGSYIGGQMSTFINTLGYIPLTQPYNTAPWNYSGTESVALIPANVTDWILVELRSTTTSVVDRRAAFLKNDGTLVDLDGMSNIKFPTVSAGNYYVVIIHRNHLSVMTAAQISISLNPTLYDMRTDLSKAFGTNSMKSLGGGYFGIYSADTDGSGTVNAADRSNTWNQRNLSGYYGTDVDLSGTVNAADRSSVWNNRNISTQVPIPVDGPVIEIVKENNN